MLDEHLALVEAVPQMKDAPQLFLADANLEIFGGFFAVVGEGAHEPLLWLCALLIWVTLLH